MRCFIDVTFASLSFAHHYHDPLNAILAFWAEDTEEAAVVAEVAAYAVAAAVVVAAVAVACEEEEVAAVVDPDVPHSLQIFLRHFRSTYSRPVRQTYSHRQVRSHFALGLFVRLGCSRSSSRVSSAPQC